MGVARSGHAMTADVYGNVFVIGGVNTNVVEEYSPFTGAWAYGPNQLPLAAGMNVGLVSVGSSLVLLIWDILS